MHASRDSIDSDKDRSLSPTLTPPEFPGAFREVNNAPAKEVVNRPEPAQIAEASRPRAEARKGDLLSEEGSQKKNRKERRSSSFEL